VWFYNGDELGKGKDAVVDKLSEELDVLQAIEHDIQLAIAQGAPIPQNGSEESNGGSNNDAATSDD
jgi:hypothetical protein